MKIYSKFLFEKQATLEAAQSLVSIDTISKTTEKVSQNLAAFFKANSYYFFLLKKKDNLLLHLENDNDNPTIIGKNITGIIDYCLNNNIVVNGEFYADLKVTQKDGSVNIQGFGANSTPNQKDSEGNEVVTPSQNITFNNKTYIDGYVRAVNLTIGNGAVAFFNQNAMHLTTATVNGALHANKYFKTTGDLTINGQMSSDWAVRAGNLKMNAGSKLTADYVREELAGIRHN